MQEYDLETAVAVIVDGDSTLKIDTRYLKLNLRPGSLYQFIGELQIEPDNEVKGTYFHSHANFLSLRVYVFDFFTVMRN